MKFAGVTFYVLSGLENRKIANVHAVCHAVTLQIPAALVTEGGRESLNIIVNGDLSLKMAEDFNQGWTQRGGAAATKRVA